MITISADLVSSLSPLTAVVFSSTDAGPQWEADPSATYLLPSEVLESGEGGVTLAPQSPSQSGEEMSELGLEGTEPSAHHDSRDLSLLRKSVQQVRPQATSTELLRLGSPASATEEPYPPEDPYRAPSGPTTPAPLQISPFTTQPAQEAPGDASPMSPVDKGDNELTGSASEESQETTTSTIVTTTVITTEQAPALCSVSFSDPEGYIDSSDFPPLPTSNFLECTYNVTVYTGYGVELQVKSVNLSEGELLSIRGVDGPSLTVLANQTLLVEGQVIRSPTNTISVYFRTFQDDGLGTFQLHYQAFMLSCSFPRRPEAGDVTVMDLHSGGVAHFHCHLGYELQGAKVLTCINASKPHWSSPEPVCSAPCGGAVHNATIGRVLSPSYPGSANNSQLCVWTIEAPPGQKLHLHLERLSLHEKDRMTVYSGLTNKSALLYDSLQTESVPFEGLLSDSNSIRIEFVSDQGQAASAFNIRFEAFEKGHCYEPYIQNGNFTSSDPTYNIGTIVEFTCDPGHSLEQGPAIIECVNVRDPYWNDTEPVCRAMCGGELSAVAGVVLSPNWPEPYMEGEDCVWKIHVSRNDSCSDLPEIQNGWKTTSHTELVRGARITYQCDPGYDIVGSDTLTCQWDLSWSSDPPFCEKIMYCTDPGEVEHSSRLISDPMLLVGTTIQYTCSPGFVLEGSSLLTCYSRETGTPIWTSRLPHCVFNQDSFEHALEESVHVWESSHRVSVCLSLPRCRYYSSLRLPLMYSHPYSQITVETEFDNPIYETG
uniref:Seizure related 6 homolog like n=1 Tax=Jaculus jaculus TaxID=51337 RepID=A0A8C5P086_JACJA